MVTSETIKIYIMASWRLPDEATLNQIHHFTVDKQHKSRMQDVMVYRGTDVDSNSIENERRITTKVVCSRK